MKYLTDDLATALALTSRAWYSKCKKASQVLAHKGVHLTKLAEIYLVPQVSM